MATRLALAAVASLCAGMAHAATVTVTDLTSNPDAYATYLASIPAGKQLVEDFEGLGAGLEGASGVEQDSFSTAVGTFSSIGGTGTGRTVTRSDFDNTGTGLALRTGSLHGRTNTTAGGNWFLDSNDTLGMALALDAGVNFSRIGFTMTDIADERGAQFDILVNNSVAYTSGRIGQSTKHFFEVDFGDVMTAEDEVVLVFRNNKINDGFGIDDVALATAPIPASALMLLAAVGGLGAMRRKKAAAAA